MRGEMRARGGGRPRIGQSQGRLRTRITERRIKEQEAAADAEQYWQHLHEAGGAREENEEQNEKLAQPPGKKNQSIQLLSGGEKALTAIALVFSLFKLNPAPFCLLDEVDAPLDDPNTERFCELVRQMSAQTQFLFITHNKITMELASQLVGVTMPEPGVSRVVEVDIEAALELARKPAAA